MARAQARAGEALPTVMRAVLHDRYGGPEVLRIAEAPVPVPRKGEVLVRVHAASLNPADKFMMLGRPAPLRLMLGFTRPAADHRVRGHDFSGTVALVGEGVEGRTVGQAVLGSADGALAEYVRAKPAVIAAKPDSVTFEQAAALPMAGLAALHGLRDAARVGAGDRVLINGAAGGIGTFALQLAKSFGAEVTGVCSTPNVELISDLGADHVVDYTQQSLLSLERTFDVIFDNVGNHRIADLRRLLTPTGTLLPNSGEAGPDGGAIARVLKARWYDTVGRQSVRTYLSQPNAADLALLARMARDGELRSVVDGPYPLDDAVEAMRRLASRRARGKVVLTVAS